MFLTTIKARMVQPLTVIILPVKFIRSMMAIATSAIRGISEEERRWAVVGISLTKILTPALRNVLATELQTWYRFLCKPPVEIDKQVSSTYKKKLPPSKFQLKYENINNNKSRRAYDYAVKDSLSLAKLFLQPFMAMFTGFDQTMDLSAILAVMCEADPFVKSGAAVEAKKIRSDIRNKWAHCNFSEWTKPVFNAAFQDMDSLVKMLNLTLADKKALCDDLDSWKNKGMHRRTL